MLLWSFEIEPELALARREREKNCEDEKKDSLLLHELVLQPVNKLNGFFKPSTFKNTLSEK